MNEHELTVEESIMECPACNSQDTTKNGWFLTYSDELSGEPFSSSIGSSHDHYILSTTKKQVAFGEDPNRWNFKSDRDFRTLIATVYQSEV